MATKNRVDTNNLFKKMISPIDRPEESPDEKAEEKQQETISEKETIPGRAGRKPDEEKKIQVSVYLTPEQARELRIQGAEKVKEQDKSAISRVGIGIALALSDEEYIYLKEEATRQGKVPGDIVKEALGLYRNR